ncbi:MAG: patatin-like phospholipase family protein [Acidobacteria bacterium]|nr:patatin-like phospholipase family protein [Acidobacteriota bacterium]
MEDITPNAVESREPPTTAEPRHDDLAIVLDGGGARAAYQVGLLRWLARRHPDLQLRVITGVSAGAINAAFLASHRGTLSSAVDDLSAIWTSLTVDQVFRVDTRSLTGHLWHWGLRLVSGGNAIAPPVSGLVDTAPMRRTLRSVFTLGPGGEIDGIDRNIETGRLAALAVTASSYSTGRSVVWVQGRSIQDWERPFRHSKQARITLDHVLASTALPLLFPAVQVGDAWYGDGGIRLTAPLAAAIHLGASRILAFSTRYRGTRHEREQPQVQGYPPPMQIAGQLLNAIFLDDHDRDALNLTRINHLLANSPPERRHGLRTVDLVLMRPSQDIGRLAGDYEARLPRLFRHLLRSAGARGTKSPDLLSLLMFDPVYLKLLMAIGEADAEARCEEIDAVIKPASRTVGVS